MMWWPLLRNLIWLLLIVSLAEHVVTFSLPGCNNDNNFDIVQNQQPFITCTGLKAGNNIYWSITDPSSQEIRLAECRNCKDGCQGCARVVAGYNVSRESNDSTTLQFLNPSLVTDGSTIQCAPFQNQTIATCRLFVVPAYTIPECRQKALTISENTQLKCEGLLRVQSMYWTITYGNGTVTTVAKCAACGNSTTVCPDCYVTNTDFNVTREDNFSTVVIQNNIEHKDDTTLRCSKGDNVTHDECTLCVKSKPFALLECSRNDAKNSDIVQNQLPSLTCIGLKKEHNIYWSIKEPSSKEEIRIGECGNCKQSCPPCSSQVEGYNVSRQERNTTLHFLNPAQITDTSIIRCSSVNNCSKDMCNIFVVPAYTISECSDNTIKITENRKTPIICEGLLALQNMYWTITYPNKTVSTVAECTVCTPKAVFCPSCIIVDDDFNVTREGKSSTLVVHSNVRQKDGATLRCSKKDNVTHRDCTISVQPLHSNQETSTDLPVALVAGGVFCVVVIVAVAVVIAVFIKHKRSKREATEERRDTVPLDDEFEEHINDFYQSADDPDLPRRSSTNSPTPQSSTNPSFDPQGVGSDDPQNHVYAQVNKGKKGKSDGNKDKPGNTHDVKQLTKGGNIQKTVAKGDKGGPSPEEQGAVSTKCVSDTKKDNSVTNVYMNVDESPPLHTDQDNQAAKKDGGDVNLQRPDPNTYYDTKTTQHQAACTNMQPVLNSAETEDEYRHLQLSRPEQLEENPTYNHLEDV